MSAKVMPSAVHAYPLHYYFENCFVLGAVLGRSDSAVRCWLRFAGVLLAWLAVIFAASAVYGALWLPEPGIGLLEDRVMLGVCLWQLGGMATLLYLLRSLDAVLIGLPDLLKRNPAASASNASEIAEVERIRAVVSIRHPTARVIYYALLVTTLGLVAWFQVWLPHGDAGARSWALWPQKFAVLYYLVAVPWTLFYYTFVYAHFVWFLFVCAFYVFRRIARTVGRDRAALSPIRMERTNGLERLGAVSLCSMLLASGGLLIVVPWVAQFPTDKPMDASVKFVMVLYGAILFLLYLLPIWHVHRALLKARKAGLLILAGLFSQNFERINRALEQEATRSSPSEQSEQIYDIAARLGGFDSLYRRIEQMSTWPTSKTTDRLAFMVIGSPIVTAVGSWDKPASIVKMIQWMWDKVAPFVPVIG